MKKFLSFISILAILSQYIFIFSVFSYFEPLGGFRINNVGNSTYSFNPGNTFSIDYFTQNDFGDTIKDVFINFNFSDNTKFNYNGINQATSINWSDITNPIPTSAYNQINGFSYNITTPSYPEITNGTDFWLIRKTNNYNSFNILNNISTYENTLSAWVSAKKASDNTNINGNTSIKTIFVNVKPHITDYYFEKSDGNQTTSQVQGSDAESVNLVLKVKDYNGCSNISGGTVSADLTQLGLSNNETLTYQSCEGDGRTAVFKKYGITTNVSLGDKVFNSSHFIATDADGNVNDANDSRFGSEDKKTNLNLTVVAASAPQVSFLSLNNEKMGGLDKTSYTLSFSGNQVGEYKVALGSDGNCNGGTGLTSPEWISYENANTQINFNILSNTLTEGNNTIYACVKNTGGNIGSINFNLIKDTTPPTTSFMIVSPANVINNDSSVRFSCNENGQYRVELGGNGIPGSGTGILNWTPATANTEYTTTILNNILSLGANTIYGYCRDDATNISFKTGSVNRVPPTPSMVGTNIVLSDNDVDNEGLDGRDISVNWTLTPEITNATNFESYRIYLLPSNIEFDSGNQTYVKIIANKNTTSWIGESILTKDSLNQNLASGGSYKICMTIMGTSGQLGTESCASSAILTADTVEHATITSAKFTSNTNLEITSDTTLDTNTGSHDFSKISYVYAGNTLSPTGVASVNGTKINFIIPALNNFAATGSNIIAQTGAIRSSVGGYNNYHTFSSITDGQTPTVTFTNTSPGINGFFSGSINVGFTFAESMKAGGTTRITFDRTAGNASSQKVFHITDETKLLSGNHTQVLDLISLGLVSGTTYDMKLVGQDLATNSVTSNAISVKFDNVGPTAPVLTDAPNTSSQTPTLSWNASTDDNGNGSGIKEYIVRIFNSANCSGGALQTLTSTTNSKVTNSLSNDTYSWNVYAVDNMGNIGTTSSCDSFLIDTTIPTISNQKITDINNNNSTNFTKAGNTINITADLTNTNSGKIKADLSSLTGNASHTGVLCSAPVENVTCIYDGGKVTYSFVVGFAGVVSELVRQIKLIVSNISEINVIEKFASITVDNTIPTTGTISSPTNTTYGGNTLNIAWSGISDTNLNYIKIEYSSNGGTNYSLIHTGSNISPYTWDISDLTTGVNYKIKITGVDKSGNQSSTESQTFSLDKSNPTIASGTILTPISGEYIKGNGNYTITWNTAGVTDNQDLPENPITLEYSTNNGINWTQIATNLENNGTYSWNIPNINGTQAKLRIKARDDVGNESSYVESETFVIDSNIPSIIINTGTPPNGSYINAGGFQAIATVGDNIKIDKIYYSFKRNSNNTYFDGSSYTGVIIWNLLQDNLDSISYNLKQDLFPTLVNGENYDFTLKVLDKSGNQVLSTARQYIADSINPTLNITNSNNSYFSGSINISGTSSDAGAGISSVKISIKKGTDYWDGNSWEGTDQILLATNTSNNYASWNYDFSPSLLENDGTYEVIVKAYDKSYKENNTSSGTINIILDKTGPVIENDIFTFTPSGFYAGGSNFDITWNPAKITSSGANFSHVKLEYNHNGNFTTITGSTLNDGNYSFNLPVIDDDITIIITAYDELGNESNNIASSQILIDSLPPTIASVETQDFDTNGQIDGFLVTFSGAVTGVNGNGFTISDGSIINSVITVAPNKYELHFSNTGTTASTPDLIYAGTFIKDVALNNLVGVTKPSTDKAKPRILNAEISANNSGIFDKIEVTFSENISSTTDLTAFSLNNGLTISSGSTLNNIATLNLNLGSIGTDATGYTLDFTSNAYWKDVAITSNQATSKTNITLIDKAKPVLVSSLLNATDYSADKIELTFSENLSGTMTGFSISSGSILSTNLVGGNKVELGVDSISGTNPNIDVSYSGSLEDNFSNILSNFSNVSVIEKISPKLETAKTLDQNGNGKIDRILLEFSEDLSGSLADLVVNINGYTTTNNYTMSGSQAVIVSVNEKQVFDTDATPNVSIFSNNALTDNAGNKVLSNQTLISSDGVGPVIIGARYEPSTHKVFMSFSETINNTDFLTSNFVLQNAGSYIITGVNTLEKSITLSGANINYSTSTVSFATNSVRDALGNKQTNNYFVSITAPIIINEIMVSDVVNNNYIELHNLSNNIIDLSNWTIAGISISAGKEIGPNGYFLISKSVSGTSNINVTPDLVASIDLSGSGIILNNGSIDIDKASLNTGFGDSILPAAIERKSPVGNGLLSASWYESVKSIGFDNGTPLGTPGSINQFDIISPILAPNFTGSLLLPIGYYNLVYTYSDDILINTGSITFALEKWNGSSFVSNTGYTTGTIDNNNANFNISGLDYGRYKTTFAISDSAGNSSLDTKEFYVDDFSFTISTGSINLGVLTPNELKLSDVYVDIEIKTIGAAFSLDHSYIQTDLGDRNGNNGYGACKDNNCSVLENYKNKISFASGSLNLTDGNLKIYNYKVRYGSLIDSLKTAGIYEIENKYSINVVY